MLPQDKSLPLVENPFEIMKCKDAQGIREQLDAIGVHYNHNFSADVLARFGKSQIKYI